LECNGTEGSIEKSTLKSKDTSAVLGIPLFFLLNLMTLPAFAGKEYEAENYTPNHQKKFNKNILEADKVYRKLK
jgi:hypothetical protein